MLQEHLVSPAARLRFPRSSAPLATSAEVGFQSQFDSSNHCDFRIQFSFSNFFSAPCLLSPVSHIKTRAMSWNGQMGGSSARYSAFGKSQDEFGGYGATSYGGSHAVYGTGSGNGYSHSPGSIISPVGSGGFSHSDNHTGQYSQYGRGYQGEHGGNLVSYGGPNDGGVRASSASYGQGQSTFSGRDRYVAAREMDNQNNQLNQNYGRWHQDHGEMQPSGRSDSNQWNHGASDVGFGRGRFQSPNETIGFHDAGHPGNVGQGGYGRGGNWNY